MSVANVRSKWSSGNLIFTERVAGNGAQIIFGEDASGLDVKLFGATSGAYVLWDESANSLSPSGSATIRPFQSITDPGDAGTIPVTVSGYCPIVTAGAETRTLASPTFVGQELLLYMKTDGGNGVVTCATTLNEAGNNTITFANTGETVRLSAVEEGANLRWRAAVADPTTILSTV